MSLQDRDYYHDKVDELRGKKLPSHQPKRDIPKRDGLSFKELFEAEQAKSAARKERVHSTRSKPASAGWGVVLIWVAVFVAVLFAAARAFSAWH